MHALRGPISAALALTIALGVTACGSESESTATGPVTVYSGRSEELISPLLAEYEKKTGVDLEVRYGDSAELAAQLTEEGDNVRADVFISQDAGALGALGNGDMLASLPSATTELAPSAYRDSEGKWVGLSGRGRVAVYNKNLVTDLPASVDDLTKPEWKGKVGIAPTNASFQSFVTAYRVLRGEDAAKTFLTGLKANAKTYEKNGQIVEAVESGSVSIGLVNHYYLWELAEEKGVSVDKLNSAVHWFADGDPGNLVNVAGAAVLKQSGDPRANELVAWLLGTEAQKYFSEKTNEYPMIDGVALTAGLKPLNEVGAPEVNLADLASLSKTLELLSEVGLT